LDFRLLHLIATVIDACDRPADRGPGHPPTETIRVVTTLRRFLREGTPWRSLTATEEQASGATLRRCLARWAETAVLAKSIAAQCGPSEAATSPVPTQPTAASGAPNTTLELTGTAYRWPAP
jgi:hypothetical protein